MSAFIQSTVEDASLIQRVTDILVNVENAPGLRLCLANDPALPVAVAGQVPEAEDSFILCMEDSILFLVGRNLRGLRYAIEALAERLGEGHYLSFNTPAPASPVLQPAGLVRDAPLCTRRILFNWHNFLSGCSGWTEKDWMQWVDQGLKQRFNAIMVHCYGNSPMLAGEINGVERPVGWLTTSVKGRDWGNQHANDVRRMPAATLEDGTNLFDQAALGSEAGLVPDPERAGAMKKMMGRVFDRARSQQLDVYLAVDADCQSDHPEAVVKTLPPEATIQMDTPAGKKAFANPDHPEGLAFYRQSLQNILHNFPQVTHWVLWFRGRTSPWGLLAHLRVEEMPAEWQREYVEMEPAFTDAMRYNDLVRPPYMFALGKLIQTYRRLLDELGYQELELLTGSWSRAYLDSYHRFVDRSVPLLMLDYSIEFETNEFRTAVSNVSGEREIIPIVWAHHDDHSYVGRSYRPFRNLMLHFERLGVHSYGVIHWTTRPLDLYVKNTCRQVWSQTKNEALEKTAQDMALDLFGEENGPYLSNYLYLWITTSALFGVETNQHFISDRFKPYEDTKQHLLLANYRLSLLKDLPSPEALDAQGKEWLEFYKDAERFILLFYECVSAQVACEVVSVEEARNLLNRVDPVAALKAYAKHIRHGTTTQGERALLYSMTTRWMVDMEALRQQVGLSPVRLNFGPTQHDSLATLPGLYTYFFEEDGTPWLQRGEKETGAKIVKLSEGVELRAYGMDLSGGISLTLTAWFGTAIKVPVSQLTLHLSGTKGTVTVEWQNKEGHVLGTQEVEGGGEQPITVPEKAVSLTLTSVSSVLTHCCIQPESKPMG